MTWQLASRSTVTGTCSPASVKTRVIPTFCAITPERVGIVLIFPVPIGSKLDFDVDAGEQPLVRAHFELLAAFLVDVRRAIDRKFLDLGRQRNRSAHLRTRPLRRRHDLARRSVENAVIKRLEADADILAVHTLSPRQRGAVIRAPAS